MAENFSGRLKHAWNAFFNRDNSEFIPQYQPSYSYGSSRPDRGTPRYSLERNIISSIYTRLTLDAASADIRHVRLDDDGRYLEDIKSYLNDCLTVGANVDQTASHFRRDIFRTMMDEGVFAIVPIDTTLNPISQGNWDILSMRVAKIETWYPQHVRVSVYNESKGIRESMMLPKSVVAVVENPWYDVMNEPNSTLKRLNHKLQLLDVVDEQSSSGKLDLIIQLPYVIKSDARREQAEQRRQDIEFQLKGSQYGIAYTDGTEKITQLNRPVENNLLAQVTYLTGLLYSQLGLTEEILKGTADEATMKNYRVRTIKPMVEAVVESMHRTFLTKTARTQKQAIMYFVDPFEFVPINDIAEIADKFTRNEIATSNEMRQAIGWKPSKDPKADKLVNSNMPQPADPAQQPGGSPPSFEAPPADNVDTSRTQ